jgi:hypothetical protein
MKFVNYGIPTGLGIKEFNTKTHKYSNVNGITNNENIFENEKIQFGGGHRNESYLPCETVFYIIDRPITSEPEVENVELTDDEELSEEIELSKTEQYKPDEEQSKLIGEIDTSSESSIKSDLRNAIDFMVQNNKKEESNPSGNHNKIRSLKGLFSQNDDTSHDTSHDTLRSILRVLHNSKNTT